MSTYKALGKVDPKLGAVAWHPKFQNQKPMRKPVERPMTIEFGEHFREPENISDGMNRALQLSQELHTITQQLGDTHRKEKFGLTDDQYSVWRLKATHAKNSKTIQIQKLNLWIETQRAKLAADALQTKNPISIMAELVDIIADIRQRAHVMISSDQQNVVSLAMSIVNNDPAR